MAVRQLSPSRRRRKPKSRTRTGSSQQKPRRLAHVSCRPPAEKPATIGRLCFKALDAGTSPAAPQLEGVPARPDHPRRQQGVLAPNRGKPLQRLQAQVPHEGRNSVEEGQAAPGHDRFSLALLQSSHPWRPPDWCWLLASRLIESGRKLGRSRGEAMVATAIRFQRAMKAARSPSQQLGLAESMPDLLTAWQIYSAGAGDRVRQAIELLIIANADVGVIAEETGMSGQAIERYEQLFFDIRGRPASVITHLVVRPARPATADAAVQMARRELVFHGGVPVALTLLHDALEAFQPQTSEDLSAYLHHDLAANLNLKASLAARSLDTADPQNQVQLIRFSLALKMLEHRQRDWRQQRWDNQTKLAAGLEAMLESLPPQIRKMLESPPPMGVE